MNKIILSVLLSVALAFSASVYNVTALSPDGRPKIVELKDEYITEFVADVTLDNGASSDTLWSRVYDLGKHILADSIGLNLGTVTVSCYDNSNDTGDDSVNVKAVMYLSDYAADGIDPNSAFSDVWAAQDSASIAGLSENGTLVEGTITALMPDQEARYVKFKFYNVSATANNDDARCRGYWTKKKRQ